MSYDTIPPHVVPIFFFYLGLLAFAIIITTQLARKWRERRAQPSLLMTLVFITLTVALLVLTIGLLEATITGFYMEIYRLSLPLAYTSIIVADFLLYRFSLAITGNRGKMQPLIVAGAIIIGIMLWLPWNYWGMPTGSYDSSTSIRLFSTLALVAYSYAIYIGIATTCIKAAKKAANPTSRAGLQLLAGAMACLVGFFAMFIADTLLIVIIDHPGYSEFVYVAWMFALAFFLLAYNSLIMPGWLKRRLAGA